MKLLRSGWRPALLGALFVTTVGAVDAQGDRASLIAMRTIERGEWQLRDREGAQRRLCLSDPATLLQLRHGNVACSQRVVENSAQVATVIYTCPSHGHGRTTISVETPRLLRIETQGVIDGAPFVSDFEARRTGACS